jgi:hypothetical protein
MKLKYAGVYLSYAALLFVILVALVGGLIHPMAISGYLMFGFAMAVAGALIQLVFSIYGRLARLSKS